MSYFGDLLKKPVDDILGNESQDLYKQDAIKPMSLKFKSKQGKSDIAISNDLKKDAFSQKTVLKTEGFTDGSQVELTVNSKEFGVKYEVEPEAINHGPVSGSFELEAKHGNDSSMEFNGTLKCGGYDVAGMVPYSSLGWELKKGAPSGGKCPYGYKLVWSEAFRYQDVHVGFESVFDDIKEDRKWAYIKSAYAFLAYTGAYNAFFRTQCLDKVVSIGTWGKSNGYTYAAEAIANLNTGYKGGITESAPLNFRFGFKYNFANGVGFHSQNNFGAAGIVQTDTVEVPLKDNLKMKAAVAFDWKKLAQEQASLLHGVGLTIEYKL